MAFSQTETTVSMGAGYANDVWYSLENGIQTSAPANEWDIAFDVSGFGSSILTNGAAGTELYVYPGDTSEFANLDTTGLSTWTPVYNSDTSWTYGAFSRFQEGVDVGWGIYNFVTHIIKGDSLYVIKLSNGEYQKLWIEQLASGTYTFRHASLDNSMDMTHTLSKSAFSGKNFAYYSLQNHSVIDREPMADNWDLLFTRYISYIPIPYGVAGVLQNRGVNVAEAYPVNDPNSYEDFSAHSFRSEINTIGYDWKSFQGEYVIEDSLVYFVESRQGDIYKIVFTDFGGSANGDFVFNSQMVSTSSTGSEADEAFFRMYPNPASDLLNLVYRPNSNSGAQFTIHDLTGKMVYSTNLNGPELSQQTVDISSLPAGIYLTTLQDGNSKSTSKLVIR